jgi:hypothetical protein
MFLEGTHVTDGIKGGQYPQKRSSDGKYKPQAIYAKRYGDTRGNRKEGIVKCISVKD